MKCKILNFHGSIKKGEPIINEWLEENSDVKIQFITATTTPSYIFIFYE